MSLKENREDIVRNLDVLNIGPYLVRNGVLSQQTYTEEYSSAIEDGRGVNGDLTPKLCEVILKQPVEFCKALEESVKETNHARHHELLLLLQRNVKRAKKIKKGLMTRAAHKVKKTLKPKQKFLAMDKKSVSPYFEYSDPERSDDEVSMVSQDYALDSSGTKPWYNLLSTSPSSTSLQPASKIVTDDRVVANSTSDIDVSHSGVVIDEPDVHDTTEDSSLHSKETNLSVNVTKKTEVISNSSGTRGIRSIREVDFNAKTQDINVEKQKLEQENKSLREQLLVLRVEVKKNDLLLQRHKDAAKEREAELQRKMDCMQSEHDKVCEEMGLKNAELILKLESLQEMYSNEFHGTVHVKQLQVRLEAERQKVKRLEKEKNSTFGKQDLYKANEQLTKELSQAKAEISYLRHMVPKKYLRSQETSQDDSNPATAN